LYVHSSPSSPNQNPIVVLLHGGGLSGRLYEPQFKRLSDNFRCLAPDLPGHGKSGQIKPFTLEDAARRVADLIVGHAHDGKAFVVGLSLGGAVALTLLRTRPDLVKKLLLTGTPYRISRCAQLVELSLFVLLRKHSTYVDFSKMLLRPTYAIMNPDTMASLSSKQLGILPEFHEAFVEEMRIGNTLDNMSTMLEELPKIRIPSKTEISETPLPPILVCYGEKENWVAKWSAKRLYMETKELNKECKGVMNPDLFASTIKSWFHRDRLPEGLTEMP
ncbi:Alpha/Beta hydrolase protein, partial [Jimgerdemannia flammicorona]